MKLKDIDVQGYETLFLDRDGVINTLRPNDYVKQWKEFQFRPGILEVLASWAMHFKYIIIITNQRGVGKGVMTEDDLMDIHHQMICEIEKNKGRIDRVYYSTAISSQHPDRKPNIGLALRALQDFPDIDLKKTIMIGDSESDMQFAKKLGIRGVLLE